MAVKQSRHIIKGMQRDLSVSKFNPEYAYENMNIRLTARENNTLLSVTNEKGTKEVPVHLEGIEPISSDLSGLIGTPLGSCSIGDYIVIFAKDEKSGRDYIYRINGNEEKFNCKILFEGDLNLSFDYPIQTLAGYENDNIQKVYWVDGINQARVLNAVGTTYSDASQFNFLRYVKAGHQVTIIKSYGSGLFQSGVIQYAFSYYVTNGQESTVVYNSPLQYITPEDRGGSSEELCICNFNIIIDNVDSNFDGVNIYSIHRTSLDAAPIVKLVTQLPITKGFSMIKTGEVQSKSIYTVYYDDLNDIKIFKDNALHELSEYEYVLDDSGYKKYSFNFSQREGVINIKSNSSSSSNYLYTGQDGVTVTVEQSPYRKVVILEAPTVEGMITRYNVTTSDVSVIQYTDNGNGETIDPTELLYKGGEEITPYTIAQKDNTLFLGNLTIKRSAIPESIRTGIKEGTFVTPTLKKEVTCDDATQPYYLYNGFYSYNSYESTTFKKGEDYRLGVIFLHKTGKWSEAIPIDDVIMERGLGSLDVGGYSFTSFDAYLPESLRGRLMELDYVAAKPVIVYPKLEERNVIAQGILCPTVFEKAERENGSVYARSSWYARPKIIWYDFFLNSYDSATTTVFRDGDFVNSATTSNIEVQSSVDKFSIDENVFTFHSPEIEFDSNIHKLVNNCKMRLVGYARCISNLSDYSITASDRFRTNKTGGFGYKTMQHNYSIKYADINKGPSSGHRRLIAAPVWQDGIVTTNTENGTDVNLDDSRAAVFPVFPWHRDTSLNNDNRGSGGSSLLQRKVFSTLLYTESKYFDEPYDFEIENDTYRTGVADLQVFNSNELSAILLNPPKNSTESQQAIYYGNTSKVISSTYPLYYMKNTQIASPTYTWRDNDLMATYTEIEDFISSSGRPYPIKRSSDPTNIKYKSTPHVVGRFNHSLLGSRVCLPMVSEHDSFSYNKPIVNVPLYDNTIDIEDATLKNPPYVEGGYYIDGFVSYDIYGVMYKYENGSMKQISFPDSMELDMTYKTRYTLRGIGDYRIMKRKGDPNVSLIPIDSSASNGLKTSVKDNLTRLFPNGGASSMGVFLLAELYREYKGDKFGGKSDIAYSNNIWIPAGDTVKLSSGSNVRLKYTEGDTYFRRYDHLKTYPFDDSSKNNLVEIVSFMCETRTNIDGRYDKNRGMQNNLSVTPQNFNLFNPVYSQKNNFFTYAYQDVRSTLVSYFPNTITWSKEKTNGANIDAWTNISMASVLDLDGDKGKITSLNTFNNEVFCFQEKGLSNIIFNPRVQIPTSDSIPIEISNSYKVQGKRYLSSLIGCNNKWSICETPKGIYFIDNATNALYLFNGQGLSTISDQLGFRTFIGENNSLDNWNPVSYNNFRTFYDKTNDDIYFINNKYCLAYSELLGQFTSFMSYEKTPLMLNYKDKFYAFNKERAWQVNGGDYNMFFGEFKPYYVTIVANEDEPIDKIFNTVEYRADIKKDGILLPNETFDKLDVWNEYQHGTLDLVNKIGYPSSLKRKFRVWRANIPRDNGNRNRIRNTWAYVKLEKNKENTNSMELHDISINFFE